MGISAWIKNRRPQTIHFTFGPGGVNIDDGTRYPGPNWPPARYDRLVWRIKAPLIWPKGAWMIGNEYLRCKKGSCYRSAAPKILLSGIVGPAVLAGTIILWLTDVNLLHRLISVLILIMACYMAHRLGRAAIDDVIAKTRWKPD